jgi:hypothetical protein
MARIEVPFIVIPNRDARSALGSRLNEAALAAYREVTTTSKGLELAHLQFDFHRLTLAISSRVRRDGLVEIEIGMGDPRLPKSTFTSAQLREAEAASRARMGGIPRRGASERSH